MNASCPSESFFKEFDQNILIIEVTQRLIKKIKETRLEKDISQDELAKRIGTSHSAISKMESRNQISLANLILIYEALDLDFDLGKEIKEVKTSCGLKLPSEVEHRHIGKYNKKNQKG